MTPITIKEFEENFDDIMDRCVEDGEIFLIEDKAVLIRHEDFNEMEKNLPTPDNWNLPA